MKIDKKNKIALSVLLAACIVCPGAFSQAAAFAAEGPNSHSVSAWSEGVTALGNAAAEWELLSLSGTAGSAFNIDLVGDDEVIVGGQPFGMTLKTEGVAVVGFSPVMTESGRREPGYESGLRTGDLITAISGEKITSAQQLIDIVSQSGGKTLTFEILREGGRLTIELKPLLSAEDGEYKAGILIKDSISGIGTLTFYRPQTGVFAGLGHGICDGETGEPIEFADGFVTGARIFDIVRGQSGAPGELMGAIGNTRTGSLDLNTHQGVYGTMSADRISGIAMPVAARSEVKTGKAYIYCTVEGDAPQRYEILIEKIDPIGENGAKNMVIKITDPALIEKTGGIVQGMSGSPIVQNGKLIGAVTHVFINNPQKGYGIFADTMLALSDSLDASRPQLRGIAS